MERVVADVGKVYAPGKPEDLYDQEDWEREKQHIINPNATVALRSPEKKIDTRVAPEARSSDGSLDNVGTKLIGTTQCRECLHRFETKKR